ncbi:MULTISPECIES: Cu(I)-responsive transcriptional regulator [Paraburkholderia]|uniref:Cu(I)-responsive transcriptional regulator n=1 Tax=Paraburkholderia madseniana TaxID=2599607 RepID=A0AAP5BKV5_9BURK|nr:MULTISPECIES: Cu(I)-responsive transcriptional regulator [Paraburkholderia]MCX4151680.1 Cu(I)-responsive transcriptional regulator [Paraburkholderia madseniana]MCX4176955.1 Cu(I)-responsive transcriptional regulator [Paraburkholderia madseniana]MDN7154608.1 Cu(I)-responsive transcriptional regulator [Paraburkholderia sp. WS6]MDQ6413491.1 Cu(I)-responsive transcriptional regulator [Paraburkholderia madseniana]MDQ6464945.1 Cu(I)-responsive transcriptional regulator [Paraburkholderia madsenian
MNIGDAAKATGMSVKMIRYYESIDLIQPHGRTDKGYRIYKDSDVHVLRFIRQARSLAFPIEHVRQLLALSRDEDRASSDVKAVALKHIAELNAQIAELTSMRDSLDQLAQQCAGDSRSSCAILQGIQRIEADNVRPVDSETDTFIHDRRPMG